MYFNKLITVNGIIISANKSELKARKLVVECKNCHHIKEIEVPDGLSLI